MLVHPEITPPSNFHQLRDTTFGDGPEEFWEAAIAMGEVQVFEEARQTLVEHGDALTAGRMRERTAKPGLADAARANDILPAFLNLRFGSGIRFTHGLVRLCKLSPGQSRVGLPI